MRPTLLALYKKDLFSLHFGLEDNIPGHSIERIAYLFIFKIARVFLIPTD